MTKTIILHHLTGQYPMAGVAFHTLNYALGLIRLGYNVFLVEDSDALPYNPKVQSNVMDSSYSVQFLKKIMERFNLGDRWAYYRSNKWAQKKSEIYGSISKEKLARLYKDSDAILNLYGSTKLRKEHLNCPVRIYMETDPVPNEIKVAKGDVDALNYLRAHTHHFTYGENFGNSDCPIPLPEEFEWYKTRPPVVLDLWKYRYNPNAEKFTTITTWRNDKEGVIFKGKKYYWSKHLTFPRYQNLPGLTSQRFELAVGGDYAESALSLQKNKWSLIDAYKVSRNLNSYMKYVNNSRGEFTVAKDLVVSTNSGWFDARSVCYLAAGKPVVLQDTGFSKFIPTGKGLFSFKNMQEAAAAIKEINKNYEFHCKEARKIAEKYFDSDKVLKKMLKTCKI